MNKINITNINLGGVRFSSRSKLKRDKVYCLKIDSSVVKIMIIETKRRDKDYAYRAVFRELSDAQISALKVITDGFEDWVGLSGVVYEVYENSEFFTINQEGQELDLWIVKSVKHHNGEDRADKKYPERIGCTVVILLVGVGKRLIWSYVADSDGGVRTGYRGSSLITDVFYDPDTETLHVKSLNSLFELQKLPQKWGEIYDDRSVSLPDWYPFSPIVSKVPCRRFGVKRDD